MTCSTFWLGFAVGVFAGFALCAAAVLAVMVWYDWRDGIELSVADADD